MDLTASASTSTLALLQALGHEVRFEIVRILTRGERCVCDLEAALGLPQSKVSYHLAVLREVGLVRGEQRGKNSYYRVVDTALYALGGALLRELYLSDLPESHQLKSVC